MSYAPLGSELIITNENFVRNERASVIQSDSQHSRRSLSKRKIPRQQHANTSSNFPIIVHCHLCWDWVWQRPQQFISRLSRRHPVLFVETLAPDPTLAAPSARFRTPENLPNLTILTLQFPTWCWNDAAFVDAERRQIVQRFIAGRTAEQFDRPIQWFYDPMAVTAFAGQMGEILTVYDCMDEFSRFRRAPPEIIEGERKLLAGADVVFTGGRKLFEAKSRSHRNCHFYGCGVDGAHFGQARLSKTQLPPDIKKIPKPVLGYFGVVDERMDYELLVQLAEARADWSVVVIGPTAKVESGDLPRRPNLHWLGQRSYAELPALCKAFDLCLMPFALNEATEFINPTKALEYMATGREIVSTAVPDVVSNFGSVVHIANTSTEFVALCEQTLAHRDEERIRRGLKMVEENSWEAIVATLEGHIVEALRRDHQTARPQDNGNDRPGPRNGRIEDRGRGRVAEVGA